MTYTDDLLLHATKESQQIEGELTTGESFVNHFRAALLCRTAAEAGQLLHPRVLHRVLAEGMTLPPGHVQGDYRRVRVGVNTANGPHEFPPPEDVPHLMAAWWQEFEDSLHADLDSTNVRWDYHAWFEASHPFPDFNGRAGRLLWWSMAMLADAAIEVILAAERFDYYGRLETWRRVNCNRPLMNPFGSV